MKINKCYDKLFSYVFGPTDQGFCSHNSFLGLTMSHVDLNQNYSVKLSPRDFHFAYVGLNEISDLTYSLFLSLLRVGFRSSPGRKLRTHLTPDGTCPFPLPFPSKLKSMRKCSLILTFQRSIPKQAAFSRFLAVISHLHRHVKVC